MRVKIDAGAATFLPVCACGWRGLPGMSRSEAAREARHHELRAHPGDRDVLKMTQGYARRDTAPRRES